MKANRQNDDVTAFLRSWDGVAATLVDRHLTVSASTQLAEALFPGLRRGANLAREMFLEVIPRRGHACAREMSCQVVAALHSSLARHANDAEFEKIVGELSTMSREFSTAWAAEPQELRPHGVLSAIHPFAGELSIRYQLLELVSERDDMLIVWLGADSASKTAIDRLPRASRPLPLDECLEKTEHRPSAPPPPTS